MYFSVMLAMFHLYNIKNFKWHDKFLLLNDGDIIRLLKDVREADGGSGLTVKLIYAVMQIH